MSYRIRLCQYLPRFALYLFFSTVFASLGVHAQYQVPESSDALPDYYLSFQISDVYGRPLHPFPLCKNRSSKASTKVPIIFTRLKPLP